LLAIYHHFAFSRRIQVFAMEEYKDLDVQYSGAIQDADVAVRNGFVVKVYSIVCVQLVFTCIVAAPFAALSPVWVAHNIWLLYAAYALLLVAVFSGVCCGNALRKYPTNYITLSFISLAMGMVVGLVCSFYSMKNIITAVLLTVLVFVGITAYAWKTDKDFTGCGTYACGMLMVLVMFGLMIPVLCVFGIPFKWLNIAYCLLGVFIFTFYIIYDTQRIIGGKHKTQFSVDDYAVAALELYLDIINMFLYMLELTRSD